MNFSYDLIKNAIFGRNRRLVLEDEDAPGARHVIGKQILQSVGTESHRDASLLVPNLHLL